MVTDATWKRLVGSGPGIVAMRLHAESRFNLFAALDQVTQHRFLLLKSAESRLQPKTALPTGRGFNLQFVYTPQDPDGANCLRFELTDRTHADVFDVVGNDVLQHVLQASDDATAFAAFIDKITQWQHFLNQLPREGLSEAAQQGLFAELWFMRTRLVPELGAFRAVAAWAGPKALAKDFHLTGLAFEVKGSTAKEHTKFSVSNEIQLDANAVGRLVLYGLLMERLVAGGMSLVELVTVLRNELISSDSAAAIRFSDLLLQTGYTDADAAQYTGRFAVRSEKFFDVRDAFPRIVGKDLRQGVGDVRYSILLSECERYALNDAEVRALIRTTR
jgi:hypothetical protein